MAPSLHRHKDSTAQMACLGVVAQWAIDATGLGNCHSCNCRYTQQAIREQQAKEGEHRTVVVSGSLKEALATARASPIDGRKWTIKQSRNGGRKSSSKGVPMTGGSAKGVANTVGSAKGVARAPGTGLKRKGLKRKKTGDEKMDLAKKNAAYYKMMCDVLRDGPR
jgi:hypothetical protein